MNLTQDHKTVTALFEGSEKDYFEEDDLDYSSDSITRYFQVGPIVYEFAMIGNGPFWDVTFEYYEMVGSMQELLSYFSKLRGRRINEQELEQIQQEATSRPYDTLNLGNSSQVFGEMFLILNQTIRAYDIKCFGFTASGKRASVYNKMFSRMFPPLHWKKRVNSHSGDTYFQFCQTG